jgi:4'-phosphopantetheinyl transferase
MDVVASPQSRLARLDREVHVWLARPDAVHDAPQLAACDAVLSAEERTRQQRLRSESGRRLYLVAHALVRSALSHYASVPPDRWSFAANRWGRPTVVGPAGGPPLQFNLSHTAGLAACVVTCGCDCGVDVEFTDRRRDPLTVARRVLSPDEYADLERWPLERQREGFFVYWTLKEAYVKARGMGMALPLREASFRVNEDRIEISVEGKPDTSWQFASLRPSPRHLLAVAVHAKTVPRKVVLREWEPERT